MPFTPQPSTPKPSPNQRAARQKTSFPFYLFKEKAAAMIQHSLKTVFSLVSPGTAFWAAGQSSNTSSQPSCVPKTRACLPCHFKTSPGFRVSSVKYSFKRQSKTSIICLMKDSYFLRNTLRGTTHLGLLMDLFWKARDLTPKCPETTMDDSRCIWGPDL